MVGCGAAEWQALPVGIGHCNKLERRVYFRVERFTFVHIYLSHFSQPLKFSSQITSTHSWCAKGYV